MASKLIALEAENMIIEQEVSSAARYKQVYTKPTWPGGESGATIGIGVDLGYTTHDELEHDWAPYISAEMIGTLHQAVGVKREAAHALVKSGRLSSVIVPWDAALAEFEDVEILRWVAKTNKTFPGLEKLGPLCEGACTSLCFNRGTQLQEPNGGTRRLEMRNIRALIGRGEYHKVPQEFRNMKRLWNNGLVARREVEAKMFERGLAEAGL